MSDDTDTHAAERMRWAYEDAAREEQLRAGRGSGPGYLGKPSEVSMMMELDGYTEAAIALAVRTAAYDTATERLIVGAGGST